MKIRGDFVTNSSSTSFILTAKEDIFDVNIEHFTKTGKIGVVQLLNFLKNEMKNEGKQAKIGDNEFYFTQKKFLIGKSIKLNENIDPDEIASTDFSKLSDEELWNLINWIVVKGKGKDLYGIGATQIIDPKCECD
ncbi:hypothetical protein Metbo_2481 [Methanobacterium lacus]|uniref:Uncharacterized protein n=1 Tax=Methanobacterium lacus (strain AL-21) TaxID=877455 RepID=F0T760_METLA|nr:hypothetical protein [Methanobacterium lacus]ADZ10694.1 hypothetical protein Metbo_2481 [Methanobacterium lacus]